MRLLEHEKRFESIELSDRFQRISREIFAAYPKAFMRALSVATLLMDMGADESDVVVGMVSAAGAWRAIEVKLSEAKSAGRIRLFLGVTEEEPEFDEFVMEEAQLTDADKLIVDALFACRLREALDYYRHMGRTPVGAEAQALTDLIDRYCVARGYLDETALTANVEYYLRELARLLPKQPEMLANDRDVYCLKGELAPVLVQVFRALGFYLAQENSREGQMIYVASEHFRDNDSVMRLMGLVGALWPDLVIQAHPCAFSDKAWSRIEEAVLTPTQKTARDFCTRLLALSANPFDHAAFLTQVRHF